MACPKEHRESCRAAGIGTALAASVASRQYAKHFRGLAIWMFAIFLIAGIAPEAAAQYDDSNPAVYWRQERQRQKLFNRRRVIIQRPTRFIRRARPRRGYTRTIPANGIVTPEGSSNTQAAKPENSPTANTAGAGNSTLAAPATPQKPAIHIAVLGDNIGSQLARGLAMTYEDTPQIQVMRLTKDNSGLVRNDYYDWDAKIKELLESSKKIDIAIMMIGSNDRQSIRTAAGTHAPGSPEWEKVYTARIEAIATTFKQKNIPLIWIGMPVMRLERLSADMVKFNQLYKQAVKKHGGVFIDIYEPFLDDRNRFTLYGPNVNGLTVKLRLSDGVHFTKAGSRKVAHFAETDIKRIIDKRNGTAPALANLTPGAPNAGGGAKPGTAGNKGKNAAGLLTALPVPAAPAKITLPVKPAAGPVLSLTATPQTPGGNLVGRRNTGGLARDGSVLSGPPSDARAGRADDFSWPKR